MEHNEQPNSHDDMVEHVRLNKDLFLYPAEELAKIRLPQVVSQNDIEDVLHGSVGVTTGMLDNCVGRA